MQRDITGRVLVDSIDWDRAACKGNYGTGRGQDPFFAHNPEPALAICETCPIIEECRTYAIDHEENFGIWGGMTEAELRREVGSAKPKPKVCGECRGLFEGRSDGRFQSNYCSTDCRDTSNKRNKKRKRRGSTIPTDVKIQFSNTGRKGAA